MASQTLTRHRAPPVGRGYRRILVPVLDAAGSGRAVDVACRLAAERHASVTALTVIEIPPLLPFDAQMEDEEEQARWLFERAEAIGDAYGVNVSLRRVRTRNVSEAILEQLEANTFEMVVIGARRREYSNRRRPAFDQTVRRVLRQASCRVLIVAAPLAGGASPPPCLAAFYRRHSTRT
jgi:nucleotide-binding universal stress UspA family protein